MFFHVTDPSSKPDLAIQKFGGGVIWENTRHFWQTLFHCAFSSLAASQKTKC